MKAIVWTDYGPPDVLQLQDVAKPAPKDNEVLIKVRATTVTAGELEMRRAELPILFRVPLRVYIGVRKPSRVTVLGQELAGEIEAIGKDVTQFEVGDRVFAATGFRFGGYAEYSCLGEGGMIARMPDALSFEEATTIPVGGLYGRYFTRQGNIQKGQSVLVNGAAGSIGTYALQLAQRAGAEVTGVDSTEKQAFLRELGVDHVIDYTREDFTQNVNSYDLILDVIDKSSFSKSAPALKPNGRYLHSDTTQALPIPGIRKSGPDGRRAEFVSPVDSLDDLTFLADLIVAGDLKSVIDRRYPLAETAEAHRYAESGRKQGHIVITV